MSELMAAAAGAFVLWLGDAWFMMLMAGIAHLDWWPAIPLLGYTTALQLSLVSVVFLLASAVFTIFIAGWMRS